MALLGTGAANSAIAAVLVPGTTYYLSVNSASPGTTGANELTGVTRQAVTFTTATAGAESNVASAAVPNPGTVAATHCSVWSAVTAGTFLVGAALGSSVTAASITFAAGAATFTAS
jgi:hypothetical protein